METIDCSIRELFLELTEEIQLALDRDGNIKYINPRGCEMLGMEEKNILGLNWFDHFFEKALKDEVKGVYLELIKGNIEFQEYFENKIVCSQGEPRMISWHNHAIYDDDGNITLVLSSGLDITREKHIEAELIEANMKVEALLEETQNL